MVLIKSLSAPKHKNGVACLWPSFVTMKVARSGMKLYSSRDSFQQSGSGLKTCTVKRYEKWNARPCLLFSADIH